jgi:F-type H+-transporting ATPase subunit b
MLIDWFTVISQALNFLLLVWLMKHFLYGPILKAIEKREAKIADTIAKAKTENEKANTLRTEFEKKNTDIDKNKDDLLKKGQDEANSEKTKLLEGVKKEADDSRKKWREALETEQKDTNDRIQKLVRDEVFSIAKKALKDLADTELEDCIYKEFIKRLVNIDQKEISAIQGMLQIKHPPLLVESTYELSADQQKHLQKAAVKIFNTDVDLKFENSPSLISGIRLTIGGKRIEWSIANYLETLKNSMHELAKPPVENKS